MNLSDGIWSSGGRGGFWLRDVKWVCKCHSNQERVKTRKSRRRGPCGSDESKHDKICVEPLFPGKKRMWNAHELLEGCGTQSTLHQRSESPLLPLLRWKVNLRGGNNSTGFKWGGPGCQRGEDHAVCRSPQLNYGFAHLQLMQNIFGLWWIYFNSG